MIPSMSSPARSLQRVGLFGVLAALAWGLGCFVSPAAGEVIEGFEDLSRVNITGGQLAVGDNAQAVTEGKQAAQLPAGAAINVTLSGQDCRKMGWLRIDTMTHKPAGHTLGLSFAGAGINTSFNGTVIAGKDTLSLPLAVLQERARDREWPDGPLTLTITNPAKEAIVLDNIRLEAAAAAPPDSALTDFGRTCWPGFAPGGVEDASWSGKRKIYGGGNGYPDPLTGHYVGPYADDSSDDFFVVTSPAKGACQVWAWVTCYGRSQRPAMESSVKVNNRLEFQRRPGQRMLSPDGIYQGLGGKWTPQWYNDTYAGQFYRLLTFGASSGKAQVEMRNCQLAALAVAPVSQKKAMTAYVEQVEKDLARYRRQFVVGYRAENVCDVAPTEAQSKGGAMAFVMDEQDAFVANFVASESNRAETIKVTTCNGGFAVVGLAIAPLKKAGALSVALSPLKSADRTLPLAKGSEALFVNRVPRVLDGHVEFQPWILSRKSPALAERELAQVAVVIAPTAAAASGIYAGSLRIGVNGSTMTVPLEVTVVHFGNVATDAQPTYGVLAGTDVSSALGDISRASSPSRQDAMTRKLRGALLANGLNSLVLPAAGASPAAERECIRHLKTLPPKAANGLVMFGMSGVFAQLTSQNVTPGSLRYTNMVKEAVTRTSVLARKAGLTQWAFYCGDVWDEDNLGEYSARCKAIREAGGRSALMIPSSLPARSSAEKLKKALDNVSVLVVYCRGDDVAPLVQGFKKGAKDKHAYLFVTTPDSFAGGILPWSIGADGMFYGDTFMLPGPYSGFNLYGQGLLTNESEPLPLLPTLRIRQGRSDYVLARRAEQLLDQARAGNRDVSKLQAALDDLRACAKGMKSTYFDLATLRNTYPRDNQLAILRQALLAACQELAAEEKKN